MSEEFDWYSIVNEETLLSQGDFLKDLPVIIPPSDITPNKQIEADVQEYNAIVMSQSCDIQNNKLDLIMVCPYWPISQAGKLNEFFNSDEGKEGLRKGYVVGYHLLNKCDLDNFKSDYMVVDFKNVYGVSFPFLKDFTKKQGSRLRLLPPYREHLSQAFARFFMRVGLPIDILPFKK